MGTRSLTVFMENDEFVSGEPDGKMIKGKEICVMYRQMDGYPEGHGKDLAEFLSDMSIVNGISLAETRKIANGMGCLTAQVIAHFKNGAGGFYIHRAGTRKCWEEYIYTISQANDKPVIKCEEIDGKKKKLIFNGTASDFLVWIEKEERKAN